MTAGEPATWSATNAVMASPAAIHPYTLRRNAVTRSAAASGDMGSDDAPILGLSMRSSSCLRSTPAPRPLRETPFADPAGELTERLRGSAPVLTFLLYHGTARSALRLCEYSGTQLPCPHLDSGHAAGSNPQGGYARWRQRRSPSRYGGRSLWRRGDLGEHVPSRQDSMARERWNFAGWFQAKSPSSVLTERSAIPRPLVRAQPGRHHGVQIHRGSRGIRDIVD